MTISTKRLVATVAISVGIVWLICSLLVFAMPGAMSSMTGHMLHMNPNQTPLHMSATGMFMGLIGWMAIAGLFAWIVGAIYNYSDKSAK